MTDRPTLALVGGTGLNQFQESHEQLDIDTFVFELSGADEPEAKASAATWTWRGTGRCVRATR